MIIALQGRAGTGTARPATGLDQPSSAGPRAALHNLGRDLIVMYPVHATVRPLTGSAALLEVEGAGWLLLAGGTPPDGRRAADAHYKL